ncbi:MAG: hypothetical protein ABSE49_34310, partial [Polyangiaceae bacterium]
LVFPAAGAALGACSSSSGDHGGGSPDASEGAVAESGTSDVSVDHTAAADGSGGMDATDGASSGDTSTSADGAGDTGLDAGMPFAEGGGFSGDCGVGPVGEPTDLQCAGLYSDWASKTVATELKVYAPGLVLWSDGADKTRWIYLPPGQKIDTSTMDEWTFPVGTKIFKEFRLTISGASAETRVETRMLWKMAPGMWYRTTYAWTADGVTDAVEQTDGVLDAGGIGYEIPNQEECDQCHNGRIDGVLGFEAVALSQPAATGQTMPVIIDAGWLTEPPDAALTIPGDAVESAALGYVHMNCGTSCHNRGNGQAEPTLFYMRLDVATLGSVKSTDAYITGWNQPTANFVIPDAAVTDRFAQCSLAESAAYYRASQRTGLDGQTFGVQMPPIDTHKVDDAGLATIAAWINQGCDAGSD